MPHPPATARRPQQPAPRAPRARRNRPAAWTAAAVTAALALTATACGPSDTKADGKPAATASAGQGQDGHHGLRLPSGFPTSLADLEKWKHGDWRKWDSWARRAADFANPVIKDLWKPRRMAEAKDRPVPQVPPNIGGDQGVSDPAPRPVQAVPVPTPYHRSAGPVGKIFFDTPQGSFVCSGTVVRDPAHPGRSNLVWTAGHCVHKGKAGGWYRNIVFVPSYNDDGLSAAAAASAPRQQVAPDGVWWADWAGTSRQWIDTGAESGGSGSPYDFAVLHVHPENGTGKSLEETVGAALPVWFDAPSATAISRMGAWGYPAAPPFDGARMFDCLDKPGRLSLDPSMPTEYRIGCTMTGGSSGGGWFAKRPDGTVALVSNTSIGPSDNTWLAGPHLGAEARSVFDAVSGRFAAAG
ncbi:MULTISPECIES: trypsin-like serine peptidase [Streptomycetaceae]|uniref:Secreted protein n=1 Tax=Streptantibioticus cattleyicolor (strain ATCC 35852 / DSM 46488 / JCM 4925 / NBRC 14057 / NRRL 8057) TaxID=1003195 RepID=F8JUU3_STREN|nr:MULTISPECIES: hypothetical protein [Streptomycetaceae]AEW96928.1 secreted protein [Streptantibioticus cattleyicolor NRRL 8057 = DSM 46488]MYS61404.1 hypothetical protein [Streptomyces sp. SID5468]CCB77257.1 putative secreted protein [Streptantibioticus cattleyicolor NRRL 8057 = DSM 46488]